MSTNPPEKHWVMVIDQDRCVGCWSCCVSCKQLHNQPDGVWWNRILTTAPNDQVDRPPSGGSAYAGNIDEPQGVYPDLRMAYRPMACQQCEDAPCVKACPVQATFRRSDGVVLIDFDRCIGCHTCVAVCPYGTRVTAWGEANYPAPGSSGTSTPYRTDGGRLVYTQSRPPGVAEGCTFCVERIDVNLPPCCVEICPAGARSFGDLNDPASEVRRMVDKGGAVPIMSDLGTRPHVYYRPARKRDISTPEERQAVKHANMGRSATSP